MKELNDEENESIEETIARSRKVISEADALLKSSYASEKAVEAKMFRDLKNREETIASKQEQSSEPDD
jgi:uncharacterized protein (DUF2344 family)